MSDLQQQFGQIDIYLFDQLLRGRITPGSRIVDAGCGSGRNLIYLLREGYEVFAADSDPTAVERVRLLAATLRPDLPAANFRVEVLEEMSFPDAFADVALSSAVLHFARDDAHFLSMLRGTWRALKRRAWRADARSVENNDCPESTLHDDMGHTETLHRSKVI